MVAVAATTGSIGWRVSAAAAPRRSRLLVVADGPLQLPEAAFADDLRSIDVRLVESAEGALRLAGGGWSPDLVVVDLLLPRLECYTIVRALRSALAVPVLLAVADDGEYAVDRGPADGIVQRPLEPRALLAAMRSALRDDGARERSAVVGDLRIFPHQGRVMAGGRRIELSLDESRLLAYLVERAGKPVSRRELMALLSGVSPDVDPRIVDVYVIRLMVRLSMWSSVSIERTPNREAFVLYPHANTALRAGLL